jgi:outer membrane protein, multidrug efflux system
MRKLTLNTGLAGCLFGLSLSGCGVAPVAKKYERPSFDLPASQGAGQSGVPSSSLTNVNANIDWLTWWKSFNDPVLETLMQEAAQNSSDLKIASARIEEARAVLDANQINFFPTLDAAGSASQRRTSENSATFRPGVNLNSRDQQFGLTAGYEIDFWGKFARADDAARARLLGQTAAKGTVLVTLYSSIAQTYFSLRASDAQLALAKETHAIRLENLRIQKVRFTGGVAGELDLRQAESEALNLQASVKTAEQAQRNIEFALALLLGRQPAAIQNPVIARGSSIESLYAKQLVPAGLPSDVLNRRPDLIAAENALIAADADIALAKTAYYPRLSLTASFGQQSKDLSNLLNPASLFWNLVGNLAQPIFRAGAVDAAVAAANARQKVALAQYTLAVQAAFKDIHDALNNTDANRDINNIALKRIESLKNSLRLSDLRYEGGYSSYLEVLSAQRDLVQAQTFLVETQRAQLIAVVGVYRAVGGGWNGLNGN